MISTVATDARVLKRQAISIHNAKYLSYRTSFIKDVPSTVNTIKNWNYLFLQKLHNLRVKKKHFSIYVKRNDCATLSIASYTDLNSLSKTTPTHATQAKPPNWLLIDLQFGMRLSSSASGSPAKFQSERIRYLYTWLCIHEQISMYTSIPNYVHM